MSTGISTSRVRRYDYRGSPPPPVFSRDLWRRVRPLGFLNYWAEPGPDPPPPLLRNFVFFARNNAGIPTEGIVDLSFPLPQSTLHFGIAFESEEIRNKAELRLHFTTGEQWLTVNFLEWQMIDNGVSVSCSILYVYTAPEQGFPCLNVTLLCHPSPASLLVPLTAEPNVVPYIDQVAVMVPELANTTSFNWSYSAFA
jgi:hypothetical protein